MINEFQSVQSLVRTLLVGGSGGAIVAYALFKFLGKSWLENKFAKNLEEAKSELSVLASRRLKLHDKEYTVFPELWSKLNQAVDSLDRAVISLRMIPAFQGMTNTALNEWINGADLSEDEKSYFVQEQDKVKAYGAILDWRDLAQAHKDLVEFHNYLRNNRIFLSPDIKGKLDQIDNSIRSSLVAKNMDWNGYGEAKRYLLESVDKLEKQVKPLMVEIELLVQTKLFPESYKEIAAGAKQ